MDTRGMRNHNPLNIRKGNNWQGESSPQTDAEFEQFQNDAYGFRAGFRIIHNGFNDKPRRDTIRKIIQRWAPSVENNTEQYIKTVSQRTGIHPDARLDYRDIMRMTKIVQAMAFVETGHEYNMRVIITGYNLEH